MWWALGNHVTSLTSWRAQKTDSIWTPTMYQALYIALINASRILIPTRQQWRDRESKEFNNPLKFAHLIWKTARTLSPYPSDSISLVPEVTERTGSRGETGKHNRTGQAGVYFHSRVESGKGSRMWESWKGVWGLDRGRRGMPHSAVWTASCEN